MTEMTDGEKLNPSINKIEIGVRQLRTIAVYPLSIADQKKVTESVAGSLQSYFASEQAMSSVDDIAFIDFMIKLILENLVEFIRAVTDYTKKRDAENLLSEMTNDQAVDLAQLIYDQNYGNALKNAMSLLDKIKSIFLSERPSQPSVNHTDTDLSTSTDSPLETEDLPTDN